MSRMTEVIETVLLYPILIPEQTVNRHAQHREGCPNFWELRSSNPETKETAETSGACVLLDGPSRACAWLRPTSSSQFHLL